MELAGQRGYEYAGQTLGKSVSYVCLLYYHCIVLFTVLTLALEKVYMNCGTTCVILCKPEVTSER